MAITLTKSVVFGPGQKSLATVGYALINPDGTVNTARATTGVVENPTASGNYQVPITFAAPFSGTIRWDTGGATPVYALDEINNKDFTVPDATGRVTVGTNADKTGYALTAGEHTAIQTDTQAGLTSQGYTTARGTKIDNLDATVSSRNTGAVALTAAERDAIVNDLLDGTPGLIETGETLRQTIRLLRAVLVGQESDSGATVQFLRKDGSTVALTVNYGTTGRTSSTVGTV